MIELIIGVIGAIILLYIGLAGLCICKYVIDMVFGE